MSVYKKLMDARIRLQGTKLKKSGKNKFAGYEYFELGDFLPAIQQIFADVGLCGIVSYSKDYAELRIVDVDAPENAIALSSPMADANLKGTHPIQNLGAVETYQRRYLWMTAMEIVEHDALDSSPPVDKVPTQQTRGPIHPANAGARDRVSKEDLIYLEELAVRLNEIAKHDYKEAQRVARAENLEEPQKLALWTFLDSKTTAALKKKD